MNDDADFVEAIRKSRHDEILHLEYADWLADRNDPRADYLPLEVQLVRTWGYDNHHSHYSFARPDNGVDHSVGGVSSSGAAPGESR